MKKTAGNICVGDKIYFPTIDNIIEKEINRILKTDLGTRIAAGYCDLKIDECHNASDISTSVTYDNGKTYYVRLEDAKKTQFLLQKQHLTELQAKAKEAVFNLNTFTNKWFLNYEAIN